VHNVIVVVIKHVFHTFFDYKTRSHIVWCRSAYFQDAEHDVAGVGVRRKGTLLGYFTSLSCPVCEERTQSGLCLACRTDKQRVAVISSHRLHRAQRCHAQLSQVHLLPGTQYLVDLCQSVSSVASRQHLRSASQTASLLIVPHHRLSSYGRWAFSVARPTIWNWLPDSLRDPAISRDFQAFTEEVFIFSLLVHITH